MSANDKTQTGGMKVEPLTEYLSGAKRSDASGKGAFYLISPLGLRRLALRYEEGAADKGARNWEKGFPLSRCVDSTMRHLSQIMAGDRSEDHWAAIAWQAFTAMHFEDCILAGSLPDSLDDLPKGCVPENYMEDKQIAGQMDEFTLTFSDGTTAKILGTLCSPERSEEALTDEQIADLEKLGYIRVPNERRPDEQQP